jgi:hypothetical protein
MATKQEIAEYRAGEARRLLEDPLLNDAVRRSRALKLEQMLEAVAKGEDALFLAAQVKAIDAVLTELTQVLVTATQDARPVRMVV